MDKNGWEMDYQYDWVIKKQQMVKEIQNDNGLKEETKEGLSKTNRTAKGDSKSQNSKLESEIKKSKLDKVSIEEEKRERSLRRKLKL
jgi:hypothetical protein